MTAHKAKRQSKLRGKEIKNYVAIRKKRFRCDTLRVGIWRPRQGCA